MITDQEVRLKGTPIDKNQCLGKITRPNHYAF